MRVDGQLKETIHWIAEGQVETIDQRSLPHQFVLETLRSGSDACKAIQEMHVRGAPLIGITAAYGLYLEACLLGESLAQDRGFNQLEKMAEALKATRPTAVNLAWAVNRVMERVRECHSAERQNLQIEKCSIDSQASRIAKNYRYLLLQEAEKLRQRELDHCRQIGEHGLSLIHWLWEKKGKQTVNLLTHCNAGWLACVDYGTATAPFYAAYDQNIPIHVWVDETRPRNQGASLTAWELGQHGVPHTLIVDNVGGHLMQHGMVDMVIVGADRVTRRGDVANKIGTYLKALAAKDNNIPFYVALPSSTFDLTLDDGLREIPIEERDGHEVSHIPGRSERGIEEVRISPATTPCRNYGFDVSPARLITGFITERGLCEANEASIRTLFPEL